VLEGSLLTAAGDDDGHCLASWSCHKLLKDQNELQRLVVDAIMLRVKLTTGSGVSPGA
jgi:hypothetical protein